VYNSPRPSVLDSDEEDEEEVKLRNQYLASRPFPAICIFSALPITFILQFPNMTAANNYKSIDIRMSFYCVMSCKPVQYVWQSNEDRLFRLVVLLI
jgi:hypothetical protein